MADAKYEAYFNVSVRVTFTDDGETDLRDQAHEALIEDLPQEIRESLDHNGPAQITKINKDVN